MEQQERLQCNETYLGLYNNASENLLVGWLYDMICISFELGMSERREEDTTTIIFTMKCVILIRV